MARLCAALLLLAAASCGHHIGVQRIGEEEHYRRETLSALSATRASDETRRYLVRHDLLDRVRTDPRGALEEMLRRLRSERDRRIAFYIAELTFQANRANAPGSPTALASHASVAEFAYAFLFDPKLGPLPNAYDRRFRWACDLYNRSLSRLVSARQAAWLEAGSAETIAGIGGAIELIPTIKGQNWVRQDLDRLLPTDGLSTAGLPFLATSDGLGAPVVAVCHSANRKERKGDHRFLPPIEVSFAGTVVGHFEGSILDETEGPVRRRMRIRLHDPYASEEIEIEGRPVPLQLDLTTPIAHMLEHMPDYSGFKAMVKVEEWLPRSGLGMMQPYKPGRIPVVFVHGLMSSPITWTSLLNDLLADPVIRKRYQFWFFQYPTGNPIPHSAAILRRWLRSAQQHFDPEGDDPAFQDMVVVAHSMGGLLTRLIIEEGGDPLWEGLAGRPFAEFDLEPEQADLIRALFWFEPTPFVRRVVFAATPHRGSKLADKTIGHIGANLIELPKEVDETADRVVGQTSLDAASREQAIRRLNGIGALSPTNPLLIELAGRPLPSSVRVHSVIGDQTAADRTGGSDGVVDYWSSHLDGVASEKVVRSGHSVQQSLEGIAEIRRILRLHLEQKSRASD